MNNIEEWQEHLFQNRNIYFRTSDIYKRLDKLSNVLWRFKIVFFVLFIAVIIESSIDFPPIIVLSGSFIPDNIINVGFIPMEFGIISLIAIGWVSNSILSFILHYFAFLLVNWKANYPIFKILKFNKTFKGFIWWVVSPDYFFSKFFKQQLKKRTKPCPFEDCFKDSEGICVQQWDEIKVVTKFYVEYSNWFNLLFVLLISSFLISLFEFSGDIHRIVLFYLILRAFSRFIEIGYAFYNDVVNVDGKTFLKDRDNIYINGWKSSFIRKPARISLAIHSLIEVIILFSLIYFVLYIGLDNESQKELLKVITGGEQQKSLLFYQFLLFSSSISVFNFSFIFYPDPLWSIIHVLQVILSIILIVLSIAAYLGINDKLLPREERFFIEVLQKSKRKR